MTEEKIKLWDDFLNEWPPERIHEMSLDEYTNLNRDNAFCYWLESRTNALGSIWGGSSYKFGIYLRSDLTKEDKRSSYKTDGTYAWADKYGATKDDAFSAIKSIIADIIKCAVSGDLEKIESIDLGHAVKWKIAALYNRTIPLIYKTDIVDYLIDHFKFDSKLPFHEKLIKLATLAEGQHMITLSENLWSWWDAAQQQNLSSDPLDKNWEILHATIKAIGDEKAVRLFFSLFKEITARHHLAENNEKYYTAALFTHKRLHLTLGSRYTLTVEKSKTASKIGCYLRLADMAALNESLIRDIRISDFYHNKEKIGIWAEFPFDKFDGAAWLPSIVEASAIELSQSKSQYRSRGLHNPWIYRAAYDESILNQLFNENLPVNQHIPSETMDKKIPLNQILYGPPGTGKTFNTINEAVCIANPTFDINTSRELVKKEYERLVEVGIIEFITFHQSMSYEDFIEGIKPLKPNPDDINLKYDIQDGLFKIMCKKAESNFESSKTENAGILNFEEAFDKLKDEWEEDNQMKFPLKTVGYDFTIIGFTNSSIQFQKASGGTGHTLSINTLKDYYYKKRPVRNTGVGIYYPGVLERLMNYSSKRSIKTSLQNYVLIIDEINRGNISQIFGELITLIEADKRMGCDEEVKLKLPYSKDEFSVPKNLYIIGTMNTADRSIEALDTALRRRFTFVEMPPKSEIIRTDGKSKGEIDGIDLVLLLETINIRIEKLLDKDHKIGHSYFLEATTFDDLKVVFKNKIIPLLEEYFYGDFGKIGLILGSAFVVEKARDNFSFAKFDGFDKDIISDLKERKVYQISPEDNWKIDSFKAIYSNP